MILFFSVCSWGRLCDFICGEELARGGVVLHWNYRYYSAVSANLKKESGLVCLTVKVAGAVKYSGTAVAIELRSYRLPHWTSSTTAFTSSDSWDISLHWSHSAERN